MKKQKKLKEIPIFKTEDEERDFWAIHSIFDFPGHFKPVKLDLSKLRFTKSLEVKTDKHGKKILVKTYMDKGE